MIMWDAGGFGVLFGLAIWWYLTHPKWIIVSLILYPLFMHGTVDENGCLGNGKKIDRGTLKFLSTLGAILVTVAIWMIWGIATGQL